MMHGLARMGMGLQGGLKGDVAWWWACLGMGLQCGCGWPRLRSRAIGTHMCAQKSGWTSLAHVCTVHVCHVSAIMRYCWGAKGPSVNHNFAKALSCSHYGVLLQYLVGRCCKPWLVSALELDGGRIHKQGEGNTSM